MSERIRADGARVFEILKSAVEVRPSDFAALHALKDGPYGILIAIILSQNSNDKNTIAAYEDLKRATGLRPENVLALGDRLAEVIRRAGMVRQKSSAISALSRLVLERGERFLSEAPPDEVKEALLKIRGIGPKTVDVFLSLYRHVPVFAVDTHARRIAARWGLVRVGASYEEVSRALLEFFGPERADEAHRLVIAFGRSFCRARNPRCGECPLRDYCPSASSPGAHRGR
ncbi:MAG: endonuclease III domain-containing protein [Acidilobus sp.]